MMAKKKTEPCRFCGKPTDAQANHCYGCGAIICDQCDKGNPCLPCRHTPEDHLRDWDDNGFIG